MNNITFFQTPKGSNKWYNYISFPILMLLFAGVFSIPAFFVKAKANTILHYFQMLLPSAMMVISTFLVLKWIHKRSGYTLINASKIRWKRILWSIGIYGSILIVIELLSWTFNPRLYHFTFDAKSFFYYALISLVLIPFQATGEELLFRGYFLQGVAWRTKRPWLAVMITSIIFGLLHLANPEIKAFGYEFIISYIIMGFCIGVMTVMDDGSELAIGVHIINNLYASIFVGYSSSVLQSNTLFSIKDYDPVYWSIIAILIDILFVVICYKKFRWASPKTFFEKLN